MKLRKVGECTWEIPREGGMRVSARVVASPSLLADITGDPALEQLVHVAHLPGVVGHAWAMPDCHMGYGFPIGGVAATRVDGGVISPGGVGYDINCGVRMLVSELSREDVAGRLDDLVARIYARVPCGASPRESGVGALSAADLREVLVRGAAWAVERGLGESEDLERCEENGAMPGADPDAVSERAIDRGRRQLGSLGSGNHFLEVGVVRRVFDARRAEAMGLVEGRVTVLVHTGSRGLGHQVCTDFLREMAGARFDFDLPDRQLAAAPIDSAIGRRYLGAMAAAANFAWANRQVITALVRRAFADALGGPSRARLPLLYDVSHNIAKLETHRVEGRRLRVCVHRKGATRALPPGDRRLPVTYRDVGQPVLVPGDMGRASYVCAGTDLPEVHAFHSSCHGAGRRLSRRAAVRRGHGRSIPDELRRAGVVVRARSPRTLAEEMPEAYKDVAEVVRSLERAGLVAVVAEVAPMGVVKG